MNLPVGGTGRTSLADVVLDRMYRAIRSGLYRPDERLPTEHELAAEFEVSRPIVHEALRRLREQGLIYSRQRAGSFARSIGLKQPLGFGQLENVSDLLNCYEFRLMLEPEAAALAAERHRPATLTSIEAALEPSRRCPWLSSGMKGGWRDSQPISPRRRANIVLTLGSWT